MILILFLFILIAMVVITFVAYFRPTTPVWLKRLLLLITIAIGALPVIFWVYTIIIDLLN